MNPVEEIKKFFEGDVLEDEETLKKYSRDASLFEVMPRLVVFPKTHDDVKKLVLWVKDHQGYSLTARAGGSDMTGGPLNESIIVDVTKYLNKVGEISEAVSVEPGLFYRDL